MQQRALVVAIDGPSGAGKGTVARTIAGRLGYRHIDTGAMYRAVAWKALEDGIDLQDADAVAGVARAARIDLDDRTIIDGQDVSHAIRTPRIDRAAAIVAQHPPVRSVLVARQREMGAPGSVVMEGRDIGSVVFPDADVKVYLDASTEERARRRSLDAAHAASQEADNLPAVARAIAERDERDRTRSTSPLTLASGAVYIDTTGLTIEDVVGRVLALVDARAANAVGRSSA
jgi:cytidylate kinase